MTVTETNNITGQIQCYVFFSNILLGFPPLHECMQNRLHQFLHIPTHFLLNLYSVESQLKLFY